MTTSNRRLAPSTRRPLVRSALVGGALACHAVSAGAQLSRTGDIAQPTETVNDHRVRYMLGGAAVGGVLAFGYYHLSEKGARSGRCEPANCALPYLSVAGALFGLFVAKEKGAERRAVAPRAGEALTFPMSDVTLPSAASGLAVRDTLLVAATDSGAQLLRAAQRPVALRRRGAGLSNVRSVALAGADPRLFIGTGTALWETPLTTGLLSRVADGPVDALAATGDVIVSTSAQKLRVRRGTGANATTDSLSLPVSMTAIAPDGPNRWLLTSDSLLFTLTTTPGASPELSQRLQFTGQARAVTSNENWIVVALGGDGLAIWPRSALAGGGGVVSPVTLRGEPRYAFDAAFVGEKLFVAGGVDGVIQVEVSPVAKIVGSSRQVGYATSIISDGGVLWVSDGNAKRVVRITPP